MAVKVISYGLLELMIRRPFLEPLIEKMSQVFVQLSSCTSLRLPPPYSNLGQAIRALPATPRKGRGC